MISTLSTAGQMALETFAPPQIYEAQRRHHPEVARTSASRRIEKLRLLHDSLLKYQDEINAAMWTDFRKCPVEVGISEIGVVNSEIRYAIRRLRSWMRPKSVGTPIMLLGTRSEIRYTPKGVCLILSPWNFPFNLTLTPLVSAIAAGNCVVIKPSEHGPASSAVMRRIIEECFPPEEVCLLEGDAGLAQALLELPFHHIFFTGGSSIGKLVMKAAAEHLSSVTLELGGKSPVIVDESANLDQAAASIAWLKAMNAGQTCIACDYVLVQESVAEELTRLIGAKMKQFYGQTPEERLTTPDYCRMITDRHFQRAHALLEEAKQMGAKVAFGGRADASERYIEPTILTEVPDSAEIWQEEIFGPLLPIRTYRKPEEAIAFINALDRPLSMYIFSARKSDVVKILQEAPAGGVSVNDTGIHFYNPSLPFGGINNSGTGQSHGKFGFLEFSNQCGVTYQNTIFPHTRLFLPPYRSRLANWMLKGVMKWF